MAEILTSLETARAVWRLLDEGRIEPEVIEAIWQNLASRFCTKRHLAAMPTEPLRRREFLNRKLHTTVHYIDAARMLGDFTREQFELTMRCDDGEVEAWRAVAMRVSRVRVAKLARAVTQAERDALVQRFCDEDAGIGEGGERQKVSRPSRQDLLDRVDFFRSSIMRKMALACAGETGDRVAGLADDDERVARLERAAGAPEQECKSLECLRETLKSRVRSLEPRARALVRGILELQPKELDALLDDYEA